jgi:hypothetical protein
VLSYVSRQFCIPVPCVITHRFSCTDFGFRYQFLHAPTLSVRLTSGSLAEVPALESSLLRPEHALVSLASSRWRWTAEDPWPPIACVLQTPIYKNAEYEGLRARLRQPAPTQPPLLRTVSGRFVGHDNAGPCSCRMVSSTERTEALGWLHATPPLPLAEPTSRWTCTLLGLLERDNRRLPQL